jgi:hypothetical protein
VLVSLGSGACAWVESERLAVLTPTLTRGWVHHQQVESAASEWSSVARIAETTGLLPRKEKRDVPPNAPAQRAPFSAQLRKASPYFVEHGRLKVSARAIDHSLPSNQRQCRTCYALCHLLYPVSAAHTSIFRTDFNSTSYLLLIEGHAASFGAFFLRFLN